MAPPTALSIAGSDPGGGAGIQADLKTFRDLDVYGMAVITALTVQNTRGVRSVHPMDPAIVRAQIEAVFDDLPVDVVKIGMVGDAAAAIAAAIPAGVRIVLDPVMVAKDGTALLRGSLAPLLARAMLVTPNLSEAEVLGPLDVPTLIKGGHGTGDEVVDRLGAREWRHPRLPVHAHGTGCTLSSAIAAYLARGFPLEEACERAIAYVSGLLAVSLEIGGGLGGGHPPLLHGLRHR